jgi:hypothetical protein
MGRTGIYKKICGHFLPFHSNTVYRIQAEIE